MKSHRAVLTVPCVYPAVKPLGSVNVAAGCRTESASTDWSWINILTMFIQILLRNCGCYFLSIIYLFDWPKVMAMIDYWSFCTDTCCCSGWEIKSSHTSHILQRHLSNLTSHNMMWAFPLRQTVGHQKSCCGGTDRLLQWRFLYY